MSESVPVDVVGVHPVVDIGEVPLLKAPDKIDIHHWVVEPAAEIFAVRAPWCGGHSHQEGPAVASGELAQDGVVGASAEVMALVDHDQIEGGQFTASVHRGGH